MFVSERGWALLLVAVAAMCVQIYHAHDIQMRCLCPSFKKFTRFDILDFEVHEQRSGCDKTELVLTVAGNNNSTEKMCIDPVGKLAKAFFKCWENKQKNETRKMECINRRKGNE